MNKVNWLQLGGAPIRNDDWQFEADAVREAIKGLGSILGDNALLSGCEPSLVGTQFTFSAGYVLISGEVYYVPAVTTPINFDGVHNYFQINESSVTPEGDVVMEDTMPANIYRQRIALLVYDLSGTPPNSIPWAEANDHRLPQMILDTVLGDNLKLKHGLYFKRLTNALDINLGEVTFNANNGNFAIINTNDSTLTNILGTYISGSPFLFILKVAGNGYLKVQHGTYIKCNYQRDHYFKAGDVLLFINDGGISTVTHLISIGDEDVWHEVTSYEAGCTGSALLGGLRYKKQGNMLVLDGVVEVTSKMTFTGNICILPPNYRPIIGKLFLLFALDTTGTPVNYYTAGSVNGSTGMMYANVTDPPIAEKYSFSGISLALD